MKVLLGFIGLLIVASVFGDEPLVSKEEALTRHLKIAGYSQNTIEYILRLPRHPFVDISGVKPLIHDGNTVTWVWDGAEQNYEVAAVFRVLKNNVIDGIYLYDHRLNGHSISPTEKLFEEPKQEKK